MTLDAFDPRAVAWFRRVYGAALAVNVATEMRAGVWRVHTGESYPWRHVPALPLYGAWALAVEWAVTLAAAAGVAFGVRAAWRVAAAVTLVSLTQRYSNHGALLFLVALYVALDPPAPAAHARFESPNLALVRAQVAIVYAFGALGKLTHGFASGASLANTLGWRSAAAPSIAVIAAEMALPVLLWLRPRAGVAGVVALHVAFSCWMPGLVSFGLAMVAGAILFLGRTDLTAPARSPAPAPTARSDR